MKRTLSLIPVVTITLICSCFALTDEKENFEVEFRLFRSYMILVKGSIGPLEGLQFLIDTGATSSFLSHRIADQLELKTVPRKVNTYGRQIDGRASVLRTICLGSACFSSIPVLIEDLSKLPQIGTHIDAIVGMNLLGRSDFRIDYRARVLTFGELEPLSQSSELSCEGLFLTTKVLIEGIPVRLLVDTGANQVILFRRRVSDLIPIIRNHIRKKIFHFGGEAEIQSVGLRDVEWGGSSFNRFNAWVQDSQIQGYEGIEGIAGVPALGITAIQFNFDEQIVSWDLTDCGGDSACR